MVRNQPPTQAKDSDAQPVHLHRLAMNTWAGHYLLRRAQRRLNEEGGRLGQIRRMYAGNVLDD